METRTIYADQIEDVTKRLDKLAKKAARYSIPFAYTIGEEHPETVRVRDVDPVTQTIYTVNTFTVAAVDVTIECDDLIKANGWTIRAKVEHSRDGNIVTGIGLVQGSCPLRSLQDQPLPLHHLFLRERSRDDPASWTDLPP